MSGRKKAHSGTSSERSTNPSPQSTGPAVTLSSTHSEAQLPTNPAFTLTWSAEKFTNRNSDQYQASARQHRRRKLPYRERPFLALDGEGVTKPRNLTQSYVLVGASDGGSVSEEIRNDDPAGDAQLSTEECLQFIVDLEKKYPSHIKIAYSFNYDINMIVHQIPENRHQRLIDGHWVSYRTFKIRWIHGKWLEVRQGGVYVIVFDVFSFFGASFEFACHQYLDDMTEKETAVLEEGKRLRGTFTLDQMDSLMLPYMRTELDLMQRLMTRLRDLIDALDIPLKSWHGPGAISSALLHKHNVIAARPVEDRPEVRDASQYAYAGGRFETFRTGLYEGKVYQYDLRSAYPYALTQCPVLTDEFNHDARPAQGRTVPPFSLNRVRFYDTTAERTGINPFPMRTRSGSLFFPNMVETWVWGPEYNAALKHRPDALELVEQVTFPDDGRRPFRFLERLYQQRLDWREQEHPAELVVKLGMNSIYGKLAQRVGWDRDNMVGPHWHQLRWAGFITSLCRSMVYDAMMQAPDRIIAVETDGIFSEVPLDLPLGDQLGQWEAKEYDAIMYAQSGVYFTLEGDDWSTGKTRGFSSNKTHAATARRAVDKLEPLVTMQTRFHGLRGSLGTDEWRSWQQHPHVVSWGGDGKRYHPKHDCADCAAGSTWHRTKFSFPRSPLSHPHPLPWLGQQLTDEREVHA